MALKPDREEFHHDIRFYVDTVHERGGIVSVVSGGSGGYPGNSNAKAAYHATGSGAKPLGILLQDVVDYDTNRQHENFFKGGFQQRIKTKALLAKDGWYTTNMVTGSPGAGDTAYLGVSGVVGPTQINASFPKVGYFLGSKDQDGYAPVRIQL